MIYIPDLEEVRASTPDPFQHLPDIHSIIDCAEILVETPKDMFLQYATLSQYKHRKTIKMLIAFYLNSLHW